ncbi:MAG: GGDEF domain-containing protein [Candidatus Nitrohelix vancouverensis]|uniref:diguanylate cyclase n=1 Tax=Candidatus Nitrohelix vancouverensis TaxID=2705534 RepID=A0A7T0G454_9BACT|nr:MAG: GGDEF domain-containing protein [Candidatus Nitrohelix vancouverensis]
MSRKDETAKSFPIEFTVRIARILYAFLEGILKLLSKEDMLGAKLSDLASVIRKSVRVKPLEGVAQDVGNYFEKAKLNREMAEVEKEGLKDMVLGLAKSMKEMVGASGSLGGNIDSYIERIEKATTLKDLLECKSAVIDVMDTLKSECATLRAKMDGLNSEMTSLCERLQKSESMVHVDVLTNIFNRSAYEIKINQSVKEFQRYHEAFALLVIDIDHFKNINDQYGHKAGDEVLVLVADTLKQAVRSTDEIFRYGGEEFVVILNKIDRKNALKLAEKLRAAIEKDYLVYKKQKLQVTISIGLAFINESDNEETVFENADQALYDAKRRGRNQVVEHQNA